MRWLVIGLSLGVISCSGGSGSSGGGTTITVTSAVQDLNLDPTGQTTVLTFSKALGTALPGNFDTDGAQTAQTAVLAGTTVTVTWDDRVSPADQVRVVGKSAVVSAFGAVSTTNAAPSTFAVTGATQVPGLGADTITVQFSGPRVVESEAEDLTNWQLRVNGTALDLTGSTFDLDPGTQVLSITTGTGANLHAAFDLSATDVHTVADVQLATAPIVGAATGDVVAPTVVSVLQNLSQDPGGRIIDVTFSEAMDPVFSALLGNFVMANPDIATRVTQPSAAVLRVTFNNPVLPGLNTISLENLLDAHGNAFPNTVTAVTAGSTALNAFDNAPEFVTVANLGGDYVFADFDQALDPEEAEDETRWLLESPVGVPVDLSGATLNFMLLNKTLTISDLPDDFDNGVGFKLEAAVGNEPHDVDGELFTSSFTGTVGGDSVAPSVLSVTQNRTVDPTGLTLDVAFDEDVDQTTAELVGNWSVTGANVTSATLQSGDDVVRLVLDALAIPSVATTDAQNVDDLAGNTMAAQLAVAIGTTDGTAPSMQTVAVQAIEGALNDTLQVSFDDDMITADVQTPGSWSLESPIGTPVDISTATITHTTPRVARLVFDQGAGFNFKGPDAFRLGLSTMRDVAGNPISAGTLDGSVVAETRLPALDSVWVETAFTNQVHVRFDEPCDLTDDLAGQTVYTVRDSGGTVKGSPTTATPHADGMGVELVFGFSVIAASDTLDISGVTDLAGNYLFALEDLPVEVEDPAEVVLDVGISAAVSVSGEANDVLSVEFDRRPSPWGITDPANYTVMQGATPVDVSNAEFSFDGLQTVVIDLSGSPKPALQTGLNYTITVDGLQSAQGVAMSGASNDTTAATGDVAVPTLAVGDARLDANSPTDSVLIELNEAVDPTDAVDTLRFDINGATNPTTVSLAGPRTVRAFFAGGVATTDTLNTTIRDLAGNPAAASQVVATQDVAGPLVVSVSGVAEPNRGGDRVLINFDEPVTAATALQASNYAVTSGASVLNLTGSKMEYTSATNTVTIHLPAGQELDPASGLTVGVSNISDHSGLLLSPAANVGGAVTGDTTPPDFQAAFANYREDAGGLVVDVLFDEDVDQAFATNPLNWVPSGGQFVMTVDALSDRLYRLTLDLPLAALETLDLTGLSDVAGNTSGAIAVAPIL